MDPIFNAIQQNLNSALSIPFVSSAVTLGLAFYAYKAGPELPSFMEELFLNVFFQVFVGFMVLYMTTGNFMLSLVVSVVFIYGMKMLSGLKEGMFGGGNDDINTELSNKLAEKLRQNQNLRSPTKTNVKKIMDLVQEVMTGYNQDELDIPTIINSAITSAYNQDITTEYENIVNKKINFENNYTDVSDLPNTDFPGFPNIIPLESQENEEMVPLDGFDNINSNRNYADPNNMTPDGRIYGS